MFPVWIVHAGNGKKGETCVMNEFTHPRVSVIVPTLNAENEIGALIQLLHAQSLQPDEIVVVDSGSTDKTVEVCRQDNVGLIQITRSEFDHGKTRDYAFRKSSGDIVVFLTQDAVPANEYFLEKLVAPLMDKTVAISTGRQIPKNNATEMERLVRAFNYPASSYIRSKADLPRLGIKTFFSSDVCAAYNRDIYLALGGFDYPLKTNEDMFFAAKVINAGYRIAYAADAQVLHSHNFTLREQYKRNYVQGYEIERHRASLNGVHQEAEGMKLVKFVSGELLKKGRILSFIRFGFDCCARFLGSRAGKKAYRKENGGV